MTTFRPRLWGSAGVALGILGVATACGQQQSGPPQTAGPAATTAPAIGEGGEGGSEGGVAHASDAFAGLSDEGRRSMRLAMFRGVLDSARLLTSRDAALARSSLAQGLTETYGADPQAYEAVGVSATMITDLRTRGVAAIQGTISDLPVPRPPPGETADLVGRLLNTGAGRYQLAHLDSEPDPSQLAGSAAVLQAAALVAEAAATTRSDWCEPASAIAALARVPIERPSTPTSEFQSAVSRSELAISSLR